MKTKVTNEAAENDSAAEDEFYTVHLAFNALTKNLLPYPYSICGCYDGRHCCSHISGFLFFIRCAQRCDFNQDVFEETFPQNPTKVQSTLTLIENVSFTDSHQKSRKRTIRETQLVTCEETF